MWENYRILTKFEVETTMTIIIGTLTAAALDLCYTGLFSMLATRYVTIINNLCGNQICSKIKSNNKPIISSKVQRPDPHASQLSTAAVRASAFNTFQSTDQQFWYQSKGHMEYSVNEQY